jgi:hypothetical protein
MTDPIVRKRLKKKMLDRWENEGGKIVTDTTSASAIRPTSEEKHRKKVSSQRDNSAVGAPSSPTKRSKATRK